MTDKPARKPSVPQVDCLHGEIKFAIPIDSMDMKSLEAANKILSAAVAVLTDAKAHAKPDASLGRKPGNLFP